MSNVQLALITGASSGLGKALSQALAAKNIPLILVARNKEALQTLAQELPVSTHLHVADLTLPSERQKLFSTIATRCPDLIINNAGFGLYGEALSHSTQEQSAIIELNVQALLEITLEAARTLKAKQRSGTIMNISSAGAFFPYPTFAVYTASKRFVYQCSLALDVELTPHRIRVLTCCPGQILTGFRKRASGGTSKQPGFFTLSSERAAELILQQIERGQRSAIIDWKYHLAVRLGQLIPSSWLMKGLKRSLLKYKM